MPVVDGEPCGDVNITTTSECVLTSPCGAERLMERFGATPWMSHPPGEVHAAQYIWLVQSPVLRSGTGPSGLSLRAGTWGGGGMYAPSQTLDSVNLPSPLVLLVPLPCLHLVPPAALSACPNLASTAGVFVSSGVIQPPTCLWRCLVWSRTSSTPSWCRFAWATAQTTLLCTRAAAERQRTHEVCVLVCKEGEGVLAAVSPTLDRCSCFPPRPYLFAVLHTS
jgi:hypothetical protein